MEPKDLPNWAAFENELQDLRKTTKEDTFSRLLFRGQNDADLPLTTTLERAGCEGMSFNEYYDLVAARIRPAVETFTGAIWDMEEHDSVSESFQNDRELLRRGLFSTVAFKRYLVYLRHHGFPSPLLDWSFSPYVAAFFAFRDEPESKPKQRSIYVYYETPAALLASIEDATGEPTIYRIGPYVRSHPRHFRQQSDYTICGRFDSSRLNLLGCRGWCFHPHAAVFGNLSEEYRLCKFNLPSTERIGLLSLLNDYNLNAFSLFDSEEALLETMWFREQVLKRNG